MEKSPTVSIVIVNYNTKDLLKNCIESITQQIRVSFEIIVVDNASTDGSVAFVKSLKNSAVRLIESKENTGFAKGNNLGLKKARGAYLLLLNSDTVLTEDSVSACISYLKKNEEAGIVSCSLKNADGSMQPTGGYFPNPARLFLWMTFLDDVPLINSICKPFHPPASYYTRDMPLDWVTGAFFMFPHKLLKTVGYLDEDYFMYVEEMDFCYRAREKGYRVQYLHNSAITHLGRASSTNEFAILSEYKNIMLFYRKHLSSFTQYCRVMLKFGAGLRVLVFGILGKSAQRAIYAKAFKSI